MSFFFFLITGTPPRNTRQPTTITHSFHFFSSTFFSSFYLFKRNKNLCQCYNRCSHTPQCSLWVESSDENVRTCRACDHRINVRLTYTCKVFSTVFFLLTMHDSMTVCDRPVDRPSVGNRQWLVRVTCAGKSLQGIFSNICFKFFDCVKQTKWKLTALWWH